MGRFVEGVNRLQASLACMPEGLPGAKEVLMRGKPIEDVTIADLDLLISDKVVEDRRLEFKRDLPVHEQAQREAHRRGEDPRSIPGWRPGKPLPETGRDEILAEVVAFANSSGGTLVLGIAETETKPPHAATINPLPEVEALARALRDSLTACIEPRLPYVAVRAIPTQDEGAGVVLIETGASRVGPHWVRTSRRPTIRREDSCMPLTMVEMHDMVIRNNRGFDEVRRQMNEARNEFSSQFYQFLFRSRPDSYVSAGNLDHYWITSERKTALGAQVTVMPHFDLALPRLETIVGLKPSSNAISLELPSGMRGTLWIDVYGFMDGPSRKILGGVIATEEGGFNKLVRVLRDGRVVVSFMQIRDEQHGHCTADLIATAAGVAVGAYDRLRRRSTNPITPADVTIDICTYGKVGVGTFGITSWPPSYGQLPTHLPFPTYTFGETSELATLLQELVSDLMNAGGLAASFAAPIVWNDPIP